MEYLLFPKMCLLNWNSIVGICLTPLARKCVFKGLKTALVLENKSAYLLTLKATVVCQWDFFLTILNKM